MKQDPPATVSEAFCLLALPHTDVLYSDAFCLTGSQADAADLVVEAFVRASLTYARRGSRMPSPPSILALLYKHLHTAYCDSIFGSRS